ncbi:MAG TPA: hypothetical protein EYH22_01525 [Candidatus Nanopusillus sp.]|nr:hypothetical protein [Candidatus Nanopusillus sp.]
MTFESYQNLVMEYRDLQSVLEAHRYFLDGHPCHPFTHYFWKKYEEFKRKIDKRPIESPERLRYQKMSITRYLRQYKKSKTRIEHNSGFHFKFQGILSDKKAKIAIGIFILIVILLGYILLNKI